MRVLKFGGTSVGDAERLRTVAELIARRSDEGLVVVLSAAAGVTDRLAWIGGLAAADRAAEAAAEVRALRRRHHDLVQATLGPGSAADAVHAGSDAMLDTVAEMARSCTVLRDLSPVVAARLLGFGERLSTLLAGAALASAGVAVARVDARGVVVADGEPLAAEALAEPTRTAARARLLPLLGRGAVVLTEGFVARSPSGADRTLGRGGSDLSATLLGAALDAEEIEIWTDVDGVMTADPSLVPDARSIPMMSFEEAAELAAFGARVLHPRTLLPAVERDIAVRVLNTNRPTGKGTLILAQAPPNGRTVTSIAYKEGLTAVHLVSTRMFKAHSFLRRLFAVLDRHRMAPDVVASSEVSVAFGLADATRLEAALPELTELGTVTVRDGQAVVCVVGEHLKQVPGIVARVFDDLGDLRASLVSFGGSEINLSFVLDEGALPEVVGRLHRRFFPPTEQEVRRAG